MNKFFHRLSKWFLDLWRKVFNRKAERPMSIPTIMPSPIAPLPTYTDTIMSSKDYGVYLLQSGKWKSSRLRNRYI